VYSGDNSLQGLGGAQGGIVLAGVIGLVGLATVAVLGSGSGDTLSKVRSNSNHQLSITHAACHMHSLALRPPFLQKDVLI
jgi:hypothetical protein